MSRIYDALKNTQNQLVRMIEDEQRQQAGVALVRENTETVTAGQASASRRQDVATVSCAVAAPREHKYRTVQLEARSGEPVLPFDGIDDRTAECYRVLRTNVLRSSIGHRIIAVSSAGPGDGKTTTSINMAGVLALKRDARVLLIDADMRRRGVASKLGLDPSPGLADVLAGACALDDAIVQVGNLPNLFVLPAGRSSANPAELLDSPAWRALVANVRERFQFTVVDTTPIGIVADFALVERVCDETILVARPDHTDRQACLDALTTVNQEKLMGVVLNGTKEWFLGRSRDYYYGY